MKEIIQKVKSEIGERKEVLKDKVKTSSESFNPLFSNEKAIEILEKLGAKVKSKK